MKKFHDSLGKILGLIFGYGIMFVTFAGGGTFFGYLAALVVGGEKAVLMCDVIYKTIIPRNVRLAEAPSHGLPINLYDSKSAGAEGYRQLADEVIERGVRDWYSEF